MIDMTLVTNEYGNKLDESAIKMVAPFQIDQKFDVIPDKTELRAAYPNPFNPTTTIRYTLAEQQKVRLEIYNTIGRRVQVLVDDRKDAGYYHLQFDASNLASGIYFYRMITDKGFQKVRKFTLIK